MLAPYLSIGFSDEATLIARSLATQQRWLRSSASLGNAIARDELQDVWYECSQADWDGFQGQPVAWDTFHNANRFLESLSLGVALPSIGAEPDGELTFEWHRSARRTLSVSITPDGELHYAALLGPKRLHGTLPFFGEVPEEIRVLIEQVTGA
jgi:hypothetical protein